MTADDPRVQRAREMLSLWEDLRREGRGMIDEDIFRDLLAVVGDQAIYVEAAETQEATERLWRKRAEAERDELRAKLDELTPTDPTLCSTCGCHEREWVEGCQCPDRSCGCWEVRQEDRP